jgi:hypothetical protein
MENVTSIGDGNRVFKGRADPLVIERLENLLDEAKRGEVIGISYSCARPNLTAGIGFAGSEVLTMMGGTVMLQDLLAQSLKE